MLLPRLWIWWTTLDCKMQSSPDTLNLHLTKFTSMAYSMALESIILGKTDLAWSSNIMQPEQNFLHHLITVINCAFLFDTRNIFIASMTISNSQNICSQIRLYYMFICAAFKLHMEWSNSSTTEAWTGSVTWCK